MSWWGGVDGGGEGAGGGSSGDMLVVEGVERLIRVSKGVV